MIEPVCVAEDRNDDRRSRRSDKFERKEFQDSEIPYGRSPVCYKAKHHSEVRMIEPVCVAEDRNDDRRSRRSDKFERKEFQDSENFGVVFGMAEL